ncbi:MAG: ABC-type transport auxiliary lipoprotein family protein [Proteobacteria bacterium]|nr:ABC-type transport auxiliary lipoprotein family protein [Pseudomonadota bacterium]
MAGIPRWLILAPFAAALAACAQSTAVPEDHYYRLSAVSEQGAVNSANPVLQGTLEVDRFVADGLSAGRALIFSRPQESHKVQPYNYHFWTEPPPIMLQNHLVAYLRSTGVAKNVVTPELRIEPEFIVSGRIIRFEQNVGSPGRVLVELELGLKETRTDRLVHVKADRAETSTPDAAPGKTIPAFSQSIAQIYKQFVDDIKKR